MIISSTTLETNVFKWRLIGNVRSSQLTRFILSDVTPNAVQRSENSNAWDASCFYLMAVLLTIAESERVRQDIDCQLSIHYGPEKRQTLDIYGANSLPNGNAPTFYCIISSRPFNISQDVHSPTQIWHNSKLSLTRFRFACLRLHSRWILASAQQGGECLCRSSAGQQQSDCHRFGLYIGPWRYEVWTPALLLYHFIGPAVFVFFVWWMNGGLLPYEGEEDI
jgi:hypothetical protein